MTVYLLKQLRLKVWYPKSFLFANNVKNVSLIVEQNMAVRVTGNVAKNFVKLAFENVRAFSPVSFRVLNHVDAHTLVELVEQVRVHNMAYPGTNSRCS